MDRQTIISDISKIYMSYGIKSITMDDIAKSLKISKRTLYELFETKNNLVKIIVEKKIEDEKIIIQKFINESENAIEVMVNISRTMIQMYKDSHNSVLQDLKKYHAEAWKKIDDFHNNYISFVVKQNLDRGIEEGFYRKEINPKILSAFYIIQLQLFSNLSNFKLKKEKHEELIKQFFDYHIFGILSIEGIKYYLNLNKK